MVCQAREVFQIGRQDGRPGFCRSHENGISRRRSLPVPAQGASALGRLAGQVLPNRACLEQPMCNRISLRPSRDALSEGDCQDDRRPEALALEFLDHLQRLLVSSRQKCHRTRIKNERRHWGTSGSSPLEALDQRTRAPLVLLRRLAYFCTQFGQVRLCLREQSPVLVLRDRQQVLLAAVGISSLSIPGSGRSGPHSRLSNCLRSCGIRMASRLPRELATAG